MIAIVNFVNVFGQRPVIIRQITDMLMRFSMQFLCRFEGVDESLKAIPCSSKKLMELGFKFKYNPEEYEVGDFCSEAIESCKQKGLMSTS